MAILAPLDAVRQARRKPSQGQITDTVTLPVALVRSVSYGRSDGVLLVTASYEKDLVVAVRDGGLITI